MLKEEVFHNEISADLIKYFDNCFSVANFVSIEKTERLDNVIT